jgi:hypothetical protein
MREGYGGSVPLATDVDLEALVPERLFDPLDVTSNQEVDVGGYPRQVTKSNCSHPANDDGLLTGRRRVSIASF